VWDELRSARVLTTYPARTDDLLRGRAEERHLAQWFVVQLNPRLPSCRPTSATRGVVVADAQCRPSEER
jgi:hypothetical protein